MEVIGRLSFEFHLAELTLEYFNTVLYAPLGSWFTVVNVQHSICIIVFLFMLLQPLRVLET